MEQKKSHYFTITVLDGTALSPSAHRAELEKVAAKMAIFV